MNLESSFSQILKIGNTVIIAIFVFSFIFNFFLYLRIIVLVNVKLDINGYWMIEFKFAV